MNTSIPGFPCIGRARELKFLVEAFLRGDVDTAGLEEGSARLRREVWQTLSLHGIDGIPSNDFSWYDAMLDTALLFDLVPEPWRSACPTSTDRLFAMARGGNYGGRDLPALPLRKWFDTNYHYLVPRLDPSSVPKLVGTKPVDEYLEAKALCIETRPRIIGPYTFLQLSQCADGLKREDIAPALSQAYCTLLDELSRAGAREVQVDEAALVLDMDDRDRDLFARLWEPLARRAARPAILLQTMYGDIRDAWDLVARLPIEAVGLDLVAGPKNLELLTSKPWPRGRRLVAGLLDARSVWRDDEKRVLETLQFIEGRGITVELGTSASLAHLPWSLEGEDELPAALKARLAFAYEKVADLSRLARKHASREAAAEGVQGPLAGDAEETISLDPSTCTRHPDRLLRRAIQQAALKLPLLPVTTIGSFPQDDALRRLRGQQRNGALSQEAYNEEIRRIVASCVREQDEMGIDVLVHGEAERTDMVEFFGRALEGFNFTARGWVRSYGTRCVKPPIISGRIKRRGPMTVELACFAQAQSSKPVKGMLTGPVTILNWSFPAADRSRAQQAAEIAEAIREEVLDLERAGIRIIQIDEAALKEKLPLRREYWQKDYLDWAIPCFRRCHSGVRPETQIHTHMCYSEFADILEAIDDMDADVISFEAARSDLSILEALASRGFETAVGPGLWDIHSPRVPSTEEMVDRLQVITRALPLERIWVNPDCGLKTRGWKETRESLANLVSAAQRVRERCLSMSTQVT